ncbi:MAG: PTS sugar transporter subunit IIC [Erysipelotrichaceae bacterium]|nr:PTS sugar transporter subunit IIC [Erysipelotrichaceae bacterium]
MSEKKSFLDHITDFTLKLADPLARFAELPLISAIQNGLVAVMPVIIIGSIFLVLYVLGSGAVGDGNALLPFLAPYASQLVIVNSYTIGFISLYTSITIAMNYGEKLDLNVKTSGLLGLVAFILITQTGGGLDTTAFSASGLFITIVVSALSIRIFKFILDKNIVIKLPDSVPPNIGNVFTALIPYGIVMTIAWFIRTMVNIDLVDVFSNLLTPFILEPMATQDMKSLIVVVLSFLIGLVIYYPFWKQYEKDCLEKESLKNQEA